MRLIPAPPSFAAHLLRLQASPLFSYPHTYDITTHQTSDRKDKGHRMSFLQQNEPSTPIDPLKMAAILSETFQEFGIQDIRHAIGAFADKFSHRHYQCLTPLPASSFLSPPLTALSPNPLPPPPTPRR
jgi:hypothetical protein